MLHRSKCSTAAEGHGQAARNEFQLQIGVHSWIIIQLRLELHGLARKESQPRAIEKIGPYYNRTRAKNVCDWFGACSRAASKGVPQRWWSNFEFPGWRQGPCQRLRNPKRQSRQQGAPDPLHAKAERQRAMLPAGRPRNLRVQSKLALRPHPRGNCCPSSAHSSPRESILSIASRLWEHSSLRQGSKGRKLQRVYASDVQPV